MYDFLCMQPKDMNYKVLAGRSRFLKEEVTEYSDLTLEEVKALELQPI